MELNLKKKNGNGNGRKKNGNGHNGNGHGNGHNGNGYSSPGPLLKLVLLVLAGLLIAALVYRQIDRWRGPKQQVWVAAEDIAAGVAVVGEALERVAMRVRNIPQGAVTDPAQIVGRRLARPVAAGQALTRADVAATTPQQQAASLAELLPEGRVLTPVRVDLESVIVPELRFGDRLEIVAAGGSGGARVVASDAFFLAWIDPALLARSGNGGSRSQESQGGLLASLMSMPTGPSGGSGVSSSTKLLLALYPRDVLPTTAAQAGGGRLQAVLHARREVDQGRLLTLPATSPNEVELIAGGSRQNVRLRRETAQRPPAAVIERSTQAAVGGG